MKNLINLKEMDEFLIDNIKLGEMEEFNLYDLYKECEPLSTLGQDVINLEKRELLELLDRAMWAIRGFYQRYERLEVINEDGRNVSNSISLLQDKLATYQKPFAEKGKKFTAGRQEGAVSAETKYIQELLKQNPKMKAKELLVLADVNIIDKDIPLGTFKNKVSKAKSPPKKL